MATAKLLIEGMSCGSCVARVEKALSKVEGVQSASVNLGTSIAIVEGSFDSSKFSQLSESVGAAGYKATVIDEDTNTKIFKPQTSSREKIHLIFALILSAPLVVPMIFMPFGIHLMPPGPIQFLLATPIQFWLGLRFYKGALSALKAKAGNMDLLVALGTSAAYFLSVYHLMFSPGHLYFESSAVVITLVLLGKSLESKAKAQTSEALNALHALKPDKARILREGEEIEIAFKDLKLTDQVIVKPGESVPADGVILKGESQIDESLVTGESRLVLKKPGDRVIGGSINSDGALLVEVKALGGESTLGKMIRMVESAQAEKAPIQKLVDRVSEIFVPVVVMIALITLISWGLFSGDWEVALINAVAVLVIACPCALGLATPTSIMVGTGRAASEGILIKETEVLETAHSINMVVFDKTGTLTEGRPEVSVIKVFSGTKEDLLISASSIQKGSEHPLAQAMINQAEDLNLKIGSAQSVKALPGMGVEGVFDHRKIYIGTERLMKSKNIDMSQFSKEIEKLRESGDTLSFVGDESSGSISGVIGFRDKIKDGAKETIRQLHRMNIKTMMLTGDHLASAKRVAEILGIDRVEAEVLPEDKAQVIKDLKNRSHVVAMVGDGINDAPALALANVGIAMSTGTDVAITTAGITLMRGDPLLVPQALDISKRTYQKIRQNLFWAFIFNVIGIPVASFGFLSPVFAGAAMAFSSVSVVSNSLLLKRWRRGS